MANQGSRESEGSDRAGRERNREIAFASDLVQAAFIQPAHFISFAFIPKQWTSLARTPVKVYVYPTDRRWFRFLESAKPDEVNFWRPGGRQAFNQLSPGDLFLFRFGSPENAIVGGGTYTHFSFAPVFQVWDAFGQKNGASNYETFQSLLAEYRKPDASSSIAGALIGNIVLTAPFFLARAQWIPVPAEYSRYSPQGQGFEASSEVGQRLIANVESAMANQLVSRVRETNDEVKFGESVIRRRMGQGAFALVVADAYDKRCAITGERTLPVLEAAHIRPVTHGGKHRPDNGLLLRTDIHRLFDCGYATVTTDGKFRVSEKLRRDWKNGRVYYDLDGQTIRLPVDEAKRPSRLILEWHNDTVFKS